MMMVAIPSEPDRLEVPCNSHALLGDFARSINTISAGTKTNTIPPRCVAAVDQRTGKSVIEPQKGRVDGNCQISGRSQDLHPHGNRIPDLIQVFARLLQFG